MEIDYNELFGIDSNESGQAQEIADPASLDGGQEQEVADPADSTPQPEPETTPNEEDPDAQDDAQEDPAQEGQKEPLSPQQRRENAARRREAEKQQAIDDALEKFKQERDAEDQKIFAQLGLKDPKSKEPITTREGVLEQIAKAEESAMQKRLASGKLTKEDLQNIVMQTPAMQQLQERASQAEQSAQAMRAEQFQKTAQAELAMIKRYDPQINGLADIVAKPEGERFVRLVQNGVSYIDAYRAVWADEIAANAKIAGAAVARVANSGKDHLRQTQQRGNGGIEVPADVRALYKEMMPNATDAEIRAHYNKYHK